MAVCVFSARGSREVKNMALSYLMHGDLQEGLTTATSLCTQQFDEALNMTDKYGLPHHQVPLHVLGQLEFVCD
jgi:hypothetical protein